MSVNIQIGHCFGGCDATHRASISDTHPTHGCMPDFRRFRVGRCARALGTSTAQLSNSANVGARSWRAPGETPMNRIKLSIRVPAGQEIMIRRIAEARGMTRYQALARVIEAGLTAMTAKPATPAPSSSMSALSGIELRLSVIEALTDRSLFTASAAYAYARRAALRNDSDAERADSATSEAAQASYKRQRALAAEALS